MLRSMIFLIASACLLFAACETPDSILRADENSSQFEGLRSNPPGVWAITGARVIVSPEVTLPAATVIVRGGKIDGVGKDLPVPDDATVLDFNGRTIYAGFIDAYSEQTVSSESLAKTARYWNNNVTPQLSVAGQIEGPGPAAENLRKQGIVARLIAPTDGIIRGRSVLISTGSRPVNQQLLARDVAQHMELTVNRRSRGSYPGSPMGAVALARQALYDAQWYRDAWNAVQANPELPLPERNDALDALRPVLDGSMPVIIETSNEQFFQRAERFAAEFGLKLIIRGSGREYRRLEDIAATGRMVILPVAFPKAPNVGSPELAEDVTLESLLHWDIAPENPARMDAAGIRFAFTTDRLSSPADFLKSLQKAVERGLSPISALRALTVTPAEMFHVDDQLGTIQNGHLASFVVTDGDLFAEKTKVVETWVAGERFQHQPDPVRQVEGSFELRLAAINDLPRTLYIDIRRDGTKLTGRISREPIPKESAKHSATEKEDGKSDSKDAPASETPKDTSDPALATETSKEAAVKSTGILKLDDVSLSDTSLTAVVNTKEWMLDGITRISIVLSENSIAVSDRPAGFGTIVWPAGQAASCQVVRRSSDNSSGDDNSSKGEDPPKAETKDSDTKAEDDSKDEKSNGKSEPASFAVNYPLGAFGREKIPEQPKRQAFVHATLWTCGPGGVIEDGTLIIEEGRILAAGRDLEIPPDTAIVDVRGMHISPGMIDCHSHAATDGGVNESTQAVTCEVRIGDFIDSDDITIYRQLAGGVTSANVLHGSANPIGGQNQVIKLRWGMTGEQMKFAEAPAGVKFALGENVKQSNWGAEATGRYPQTRLGVEQIYRDAFQAARDYSARMDAWQTSRRGLPPRRDLEMDALREIIEGRRWIHCHSYRQDEILALIRILDEFKITIGTFQHILEGYKVADAMARHGAMASAFSDWWAYKMEVQDAIPYAGALMHNAGVVVSFNSDDGELARHLNQEAAKAVKYGGVSREEALKFVTLNPAKQLRIDQYVGSLEPGKHADFVIWNGDPLSNFSRCEQTWIDGRAFFHRDEDNQLRQVVIEKRNTLIQKILKSGEKMHEPGERDADPSSLWPRFDEFCHHLHQAEQVRLLELRQQQDRNQ